MPHEPVVPWNLQDVTKLKRDFFLCAREPLWLSTSGFAGVRNGTIFMTLARETSPRNLVNVRIGASKLKEIEFTWQTHVIITPTRSSWHVRPRKKGEIHLVIFTRKKPKSLINLRDLLFSLHQLEWLCVQFSACRSHTSFPRKKEEDTWNIFLSLEGHTACQKHR